MKLMFISDIHGSLFWLEQALAKVEEEQPHTLVILGDFLYHGPRNPLPDGYNPQESQRSLTRTGNLWWLLEATAMPRSIRCCWSSR